MGNKLLVAAANHWTSPFQVGSHELTKQFIKDGWQVAFISDPVSPLHLLKINDEKTCERFRIYRTKGEYHSDKKLWTYIPLALLSPQNIPVLRSKFIYRYWNKITIPNVLKKIKQAGFDKVDLIYFDSILPSFLIDSIEFKKSVFRIADNYSGFNKFSENSAIFEEKLAVTADLVVFSAKNLEEYVTRYKTKKTLYLPNGVEFEFFHNGSSEFPEEFSSIPSPRVIYIGAMEEWFDTELINYAAERLPDFSFIFIGNYKNLKTQINNYKNIYLLGTRPYSEIPKYLHNSDIGIIPFRVTEFGKLVNSINPLKLYQYFACGLPVIASRWDELENLNSPAILYSSYDEFIGNIKKTLNDNLNKETLVDFARGHDWKQKYSILLKELNLFSEQQDTIEK